MAPDARDRETGGAAEGHDHQYSGELLDYLQKVRDGREQTFQAAGGVRGLMEALNRPASRPSIFGSGQGTPPGSDQTPGQEGPKSPGDGARK